MKIFVSSACLRESNLKSNLSEFKSLGYERVELTGGISYQPDVFEAIRKVESELQIEIQLHNYSPPPLKDFVLNLASLEDETFHNSVRHIKDALKYSKDRCYKYAVHAGFYIPVLTSELGQLIKKRELFNKDQSNERFINALRRLYTGNEDCLYVENNVVSAANYNEYGKNPFMLTCASEYFELKKELPQMRLLLDLAHLKVSCQTLGLSFTNELTALIGETDYLHLSENDGLEDTNQGLVEDSEMYEFLKTQDLVGKTITLEVYSGIEDLDRSYQIINKLR